MLQFMLVCEYLTYMCHLGHPVSTLECHLLKKQGHREEKLLLLLAGCVRVAQNQIIVRVNGVVPPRDV